MHLPGFLLFDLDGTLLDSLPGIAFSVNYALRAEGLAAAPEPELRGLLGPPIRTILSNLVSSDETELLDRLEHTFRVSYDADGWQMTVCFAGVQQVLRRMKELGHRLFVVSNKPRPVSLRILEREGILDVFEQVYTRDSRQPAYASKEEMLRQLLLDHRALPSDCLMVGDTMEDVLAAAANRIDAALLEHGYGELCPAAPARFRLASFLDFTPYLATENTD